jgi:HSP20 family molecular chaperone IbpA
MNQIGNKRFSSNWDMIEKLVGAKLPIFPNDEQMAVLKNTSWVDDYVRQMLDNTMPKQEILPNLGNSFEVFETHYYVVVKVKISYEANPLVKIRPDQVKVETSPNHKELIIPLPTLVVPSTGRATYKDEILQIKIRKTKFSKSYREVAIRYL